MAAIKTAAVSVAVLAILGGLVFTGYQAHEAAVIVKALKQSNGRGAPGNSPVKIVGGSMTFRAPGGWKASNGGATWTTTNSASVSAIQLEHVWANGDSGQPGNYTFGVPASWQIEIDGRDPSGTMISNPGGGAPPNGVIVSPAAGMIQIAPTNPASTSYGFYFVSSASGPVPDAPTWDKTLYPGVRYKDQTGSAAVPATYCAGAGALCESIWQIQVILNGDTAHPHVFRCPDGECRVYLATPPLA